MDAGNMTPQELFTKVYEPTYDATWKAYEQGRITLDQALDRLDKAWKKGAYVLWKTKGYRMIGLADDCA